MYDTARVLSGYSDVIVMRHPQAGSVEEFSKASRVPVINGGDGANEHPSPSSLGSLYDKEGARFKVASNRWYEHRHGWRFKAWKNCALPISITSPLQKH